MYTIHRKSSARLPAISTASLPDIVFILLFFFMTVTVIRDNTLLVNNALPNATESEKLVADDGIIEIIIGKPKRSYAEVAGTAPKIQLAGKFANSTEVGAYVLEELGKMPDALRKSATVVLKVDKKATMGLVNDVKAQLRDINMLKINYATLEGEIIGKLP